MVTILLPQTKHSQPLGAADLAPEVLESFERITIVGWVSCGNPIDMFTQEGSIEVPSKLVRKNTHALRVRGNSIIEANILYSDLVAIEQSQVAENRERVVGRTNQKELTLKTLRLDQDGVKISPEQYNEPNCPQ